MSDDYTKILERNPTAVRLPEDLLDRAEDLVDHWSKLDQDLIKKLGGRRSRSTVLRLAILYGIEKIEALVNVQVAVEEPGVAVVDLAPVSMEQPEAPLEGPSCGCGVEPDEAG